MQSTELLHLVQQWLPGASVKEKRSVTTFSYKIPVCWINTFVGGYQVFIRKQLWGKDCGVYHWDHHQISAITLGMITAKLRELSEGRRMVR